MVLVLFTGPCIVVKIGLSLGEFKKPTWCYYDLSKQIPSQTMAKIPSLLPRYRISKLQLHSSSELLK